MIENPGGMGAVMKDSLPRFWVVEHISAMVIAIVLITIARGKAKTQPTSCHHSVCNVLCCSFLQLFLAVPRRNCVVPVPGNVNEKLKSLTG